MFVVIRHNLRTGESHEIRHYASAERAEARAARGNELHRSCGMTHLLDRAVWAESTPTASERIRAAREARS